MRRPKVLIALLITALVASGAACSRNNAIEFDAIFADVGNLPRLAQVQSADVKIGDVTDIKLDGYNARVTMKIQPTAKLPRNSIAFIRSTSLLGEQLVEIRDPAGEPPSPELLRSGDVIPLERTGIAPTLDEAFIQLGEILEGGSFSDFATFINSAADIVRGREEELGQVFAELKKVTGTLASHSPEIASAVESLDSAFATLAAGSETLKSSISSSADASAILANQQKDLDRLVSALDRFSSVSARYSRATTPASDRALKDIRLILDEVMKTTGDLDQSLGALARFSDLWPRVIPGDYVQLDVVIAGSNVKPSSAANTASAPTRGPRPTSLEDLMTRAIR